MIGNQISPVKTVNPKFDGKVGKFSYSKHPNIDEVDILLLLKTPGDLRHILQQKVSILFDLLLCGFYILFMEILKTPLVKPKLRNTMFLRNSKCIPRHANIKAHLN